jgi:hypothetical protein
LTSIGTQTIIILKLAINAIDVLYFHVGQTLRSEVIGVRV